MAERILVVEDEPSLQATLAYNLRKEGYVVEIAGDGRAALEAARRIKPDLLVLDLMLPQIDGFEVARIVRTEMTAAILMLTARVDEIDRVVGLEVGADDYLTKPFSMRELMARIKALLRRTRQIREEARGLPESGAERLTFGDLVIDPSRREATLNGLPVPLKPKEYELLLFLAQHKGRVLSRELILQRVWGWEFIGDSRTVDVHIRWLRQKLETDSANPERIITVRGGGYRFEG